MLPVVAGSSSFTIIDDVWNIFSFYVQVSLIIQYQLGCWVSDTPVLSIPVFILVAVGLCLHHRRRVFVRRCLSPLSFSLKTFPAAPQQQLTAAVQPAPAPANESVVLVTYPPYLNSECTSRGTDQEPINQIFGALIFECPWLFDWCDGEICNLHHCSLLTTRKFVID